MWDGLRREYSPELFLQARELADTSDRPNHYDTIEALLRSIDRFGLLAVRGATTTIAALQRANPMRHVGYIITLLRNESIDSVMIARVSVSYGPSAVQKHVKLVSGTTEAHQRAKH